MVMTSRLHWRTANCLDQVHQASSTFKQLIAGGSTTQVQMWQFLSITKLGDDLPPNLATLKVVKL